jgi:hypothetical protein
LINLKWAKRGSSNKIAPIDTDSSIKAVDEFEENPAVEVPKKTEGQRDSWGGKLDFFLSALSFSGT